jgi:hypothetical protein
VRSGSAHFRVAVQAKSIQRALSLVTRRFPARAWWVKFPIDPEGFFVEGPTARTETVEQPKKMAA